MTTATALWNDQTAWNAFDILGVHEYDSQIAYAWPADVNGGRPNKEVWQTEMSGVRHWPEEGPSTTIQNGVAVAGWIHSALTVGEASAWLYWWYEAYYQNDNEGLALTQAELDHRQALLHAGQLQQVRAPRLRRGGRHRQLQRERADLGLQGHGWHRRRGGHQQGHRGGHGADLDHRRDGAGHDDAHRDVVQPKPRRGDRGPGERRQLQRLLAATTVTTFVGR